MPALKLNYSKKDLAHKQEEKPRTGGMRTLNFLFTILFLLFLVANGFFIFSYTVEGKSLSQSFISLANNSLQVIDTVWKPELKMTDNYTGILIMGIDS